jgi:serine/threonine protein kinase/tetratricopeptide (TPR) repeat protein
MRAVAQNPPGEPFGCYRLIEPIGEGGMAVVFRAVTEGPKGFSREVVVKRIRADLSRDQTFVSMLLAEARVCGMLHHPGIVQVHELGEVNGEYFLAMELVDGHDLSSTILRARALETPPAVGVVCFLILQVAEALQYAHSLAADGKPLEIIHRDVSPSNIMVTPLGATKLLDFGVARAATYSGEEKTRTGILKGKIGYLSPEQAEGLAVDHRSDIFALGIVFHELLTLRRLFSGGDDLQTLRLIREGEVAPPSQMRGDVPPDVEALVMRMLARDPAQRFASCQQVVDALQPLVHRLSADHGAIKRWLEELAPIPRRILFEDRTTPTIFPSVARRRRSSWLYAAAVGAVLAVAAGFTTRSLLRHPPRSVKVLAFKNLSSKSDAAWLSAALAEMLAGELSGGRLQLVDEDPEVVVDGSYLLNGGQLRLDVRASDRGGRPLAKLSDTGSDTQLFAMVARVGGNLRARFGDRVPGGGSSLPAHPEAVRLYHEGQEQLRLMDALSARERLARAAELEPQSPAVLMALSAAEEALGHEAAALKAAQRAFELSSSLPPAERLATEGRYRMATRDWPKAVTCYRSLFALRPDSVDDALQLVYAQVASERADEVLTTVNALRKLPGAADDPRVDLAEAQAAMLLSEPKRAHEAAQRALTQGTARGAPLLLARASLLEGRAQWAMSHAKEAVAAFTTAEKTFGAAGDEAGRAAVLVLLSDLLYTQGNLREAKRAVDDALAISLKLGDKRGEAAGLTGLANLLGETPAGDDKAFQIYQRVLVLCRGFDDKSCVSSQLNNIGGVHQARREIEEARRYYQQSADTLREAGLGQNASIVLANLSSVLFDLGDLAGARNAAEEALAACRRTGTTGEKSWPLYYLGRIDMMQARFDDARKRFEEAAQLDEQQGKTSELAAARAALAELRLFLHQLPEAETAARAALVLTNGQPATLNLGFGSESQVSEVLVRILLERGRLAEAAALLGHAQKVVPRDLDPDWAMLLAVTSARLTAARGNRRAGLAALARESAHASDYVYHRLWIQLATVELTQKGGAALPDRRSRLVEEARRRGFELIARRAGR